MEGEPEEPAQAWQEEAGEAEQDAEHKEVLFNKVILILSSA
jgi:hypothetical protein